MIPRFATGLIRHERPVINGDGLNSRDFTYVDDVVQANQLALLAALPEAVNTVYNIACGECTRKSAPVVIEDDVWLCMNVTVLKGVTIGRGSVIAAGSVVTADIPAGVLAGGVPAKAIKPLSPEER